MYSDSSSSDSESETDQRKFKPGRRPTEWPFLRLYEKEELSAKYNEWKDTQEMRLQGIVGEPPKRGMYKIYIMRRFLDSLKGFYTGSLDLTGRHLHRFEALSTQWKSFHEDYQDYLQLPVGQSDQFRVKWRIPKNIFNEVLDLVKDLLKELQTLPKSPKIQQLCLVHLPPEILDLIFASSKSVPFGFKDTVSLSSTCKLLREIGKPYLFHNQFLTLYPPQWDFAGWEEEGKTPDEIRALARGELEACRLRLKDDLEFLLSNPNIIDTFRYLFFSDRFASYFKQIGLRTRAVAPDDFYDELWDMLSRVILRAVHLKKLTFSDVAEVSVDIAQAIVSLPYLTTVEMTDCLITEEVIEKVASGEITPSRSVLNLNLLDSQDSLEGSLWDLVSLFSNLRTLSISRIDDDFRPLSRPSPALIQNHNLFSTLQKLVISPQVNPEDVFDLSQWLRASAMRAPLRLTHLKLSTRVWLEEDTLVPLLDALQAAPLEVLVLDGIKEGSLDLFDRIAASCPRLIGLTVLKRENISQRRGKLAHWPHRSWEYAPHLSGFQRLEHFTWNFWISDPYFETSPSSMVCLEEGFTSEETPSFITGVNEKGLEWIQFIRPTDLMDDTYSLAYPFAVHCPTLKSFAVNSGQYEQHECFCNIDRKSDGSYELRPAPSDRPMYMLDRWDLPPLSLHWPHVSSVVD